MPRYDYRCPECGTTEEVTAGINADKPELACHLCHTAMKQVFSAPGLVFKGTGWAGKSSKPPTTKEKSS